MSSRSYYLIHNPTASRGRAAGVVDRIRPLLQDAGVRFELAATEAPGHAESLAERAAQDGWDAVVAVGGDGTVQQTATGLMRAAGNAPTLPLGVIGVGNGNDFIKMVDLPLQDPAAAVQRLLAGSPRPMDIGRIGARYFTNGIGVGFDAQVAIQASKIKRLRGMPLYGWALLKVLRDLKTPHIRLTLDGTTVIDRRLTVVTVGNGACHGGGFWLCPGARADDGLFDICVAEALKPARLLRLVPKVMNGTHVELPEVQILRARRVEISSPEPLPVHADGEIFSVASHELEMELLPQRLTVIA